MRGLIVALPNKGRLAEPAARLAERAGFRRIDDERAYLSNTTMSGVQVLTVRATDIPIYVYYGIADLGITGKDIVAERGLDVYDLADLGFGGCELIAAVRKDSPFVSPSELPSGSKVATEFPNLTKKFFNEYNVEVEIIALRGAVEIAPVLGLADAISDLMVTGNTLERNGLRPIGTILESTTRLICNKVSYKTRYDQIIALAEEMERSKE